MSDKLRVTGLASGMDTESIVTQLVSKYQTKIDKATKKQKKLELQQDAWKSLNTKIYSFYSNTLSNMRWASNYNKMTTKSSSSALTVEAGTSAVSGIQSVKIRSTAKAGYLTGKKLTSGSEDSLTATSLVKDALSIESGTYKFNGTEIEIDDTTTMSGLASKLAESGINASFDEVQQRFYISAKSSGTANDIDLSESASSEELLNALGVGRSETYEVDQQGNYYKDGNQIVDSAVIKQIEEGEYAVRVVGEDAKITLNGTLYSSDNNSFSINGLTLTVNNYTSDDIAITTQKDNQGVYDSIKNMINGYNEIMNEMSKLYSTDSEKYEPLTDEEAAKLTEAELDKWNEKLESSCLYKDSRISEIISSLKSVMMSPVTLKDGTKMYLSDFGIGTLGYFEADENERNALHIDGNSEDESRAEQKDKLLTMIATDPDKVQEFFSTLSTNLYKKMTTEMGRTDYSSMYKIYNDKKMDDEHNDYDDLIEKLKDQMSAAEDRYYNQFSKMETALTKLNSKQSSLTSYLGG